MGKVDEGRIVCTKCKKEKSAEFDKRPQSQATQAKQVPLID